MDKPSIDKNATNVFVKYGIHNKTSNKISILPEGEYPTNLKPEEELFAITRDSFFTASNSKINSKIQNSNTYVEFLRTIRIIIYALIVPGFVIGVARMLILAQLIQVADTNILSPTSVLGHMIFWISVLSTQVLWYDLFYEQHPPKQSLDIPPFTVGELSRIQQSTVDFTSFAKKPLASYIHNLGSDMMAEATLKGEINLGALWKQLMSLDEIHRAYQRIYPIDKNGQYIPPSVIRETLDQNTLPINEFVLYALEETALIGDKSILPEHIFATIWKLIPQLKETLYQQNFTQIDIRSITLWIRNLQKQVDQTKFWKKDTKISKTGGMFADWIYGYTFNLNKFSRDLTGDALKFNTEYGIGHIEEITEVVNILEKSSKGNVLLVGESGIGKTSIVKGIAQRIVTGQVPDSLHGRRVISINVPDIMSSASEYGGLEGLLTKIIEEITKSGNSVIFIDEIHTIMGAREEAGTSDLSSLLAPFINDPKLKIIGTTTYQDYKTKFEIGSSLADSFDLIEVNEPSEFDTARIIETLVPLFESRHKVFITFPAIKSSIILTQKYMSTTKLPNKAISVLEEAAILRKNRSQQDNNRVVSPRDIQEVISQKTQIPITNVGEKEAKELLELEEKMQQKIIGQNDAIKAISEALKRSRSGIRNPNKPIAAFLFMGPTGVGKTHISKTLAELYFGSKDNMIRLDMSEYQEASALSRIIGSSDNPKAETMTLVDHIRQSPFTLILLDELEKAHPDLLNVFLQLFDDGRLTNSLGQTVDFTNTIIIATSNVGTAQIQNALREGALFQEASNRALIELRQTFRPEFINRFDKIVVFHPLSQEDLEGIVKLQLGILSKRLEEQGIHMVYTDQVPLEVAKTGYSPEYGAREINRVIQNKIEQEIANRILGGTLGRGDKVEVSADWITTGEEK